MQLGTKLFFSFLYLSIFILFYFIFNFAGIGEIRKMDMLTCSLFPYSYFYHYYAA
jgi:hypothetical protein